MSGIFMEIFVLLNYLREKSDLLLEVLYLILRYLLNF